MTNPFEQYRKLVKDNPSEYSLKVQKQIALQDEMLRLYDFEEEKGAKCVRWIEKYCILTEGENAGKPVKLMLWQKWIIYSILCFYGEIETEIYDEEGAYKGTENKRTRIVNDVLIEVASGNSKTTTIAFLVLYFMFHDTIPSAKIYIGSNAYRQSKICFEVVEKMIRVNPVLASQINFRASIGEIENHKMNSKLIAMSSDGTNYEGIIPAILIIDEIHGMKDSAYAENLRKSTKRGDKLIIEMTTQGTIRGGYLDKRLELANNLLNEQSEIKDYRKFFAIYEQDNYEEIINAYNNNTLSILRKSNPSLSIAVNTEELKEKIREMINDASTRPIILTKNFNIPQNPITSYFTEQECKTKEFNEDIFNNAPVFLGLDMAYTHNPSDDLTCLEIMVKNPLADKEYCKDIYFLPKYFEKTIKRDDGTIDIVKEDMIKEKSKIDSNISYNPTQKKYGYNDYAERGDVVIINEELVEELVKLFGEQARVPMTCITEDFVIYYMAYLEMKYNWVVCKIGLDPNKAGKIESICNSSYQSLDGKPIVIKFRMEDKKNSNPIIQSTKDIRARKLVYNNNRLTELHFASAQAKQDQYGNISFTNAMRERKDGVIANLSCRSAYNVFTRNKDTGTENESFLIQWWNNKK